MSCSRARIKLYLSRANVAKFAYSSQMSLAFMLERRPADCAVSSIAAISAQLVPKASGPTALNRSRSAESRKTSRERDRMRTRRGSSGAIKPVTMWSAEANLSAFFTRKAWWSLAKKLVNCPTASIGRGVLFAGVPPSLMSADICLRDIGQGTPRCCRSQMRQRKPRLAEVL